MGEGVALRGLRPLWRLRRPGHIGSSCDALELRAPCHARLLARSGAAAFGRSGHWQRGLRPRWRLRRPLALALACDCLEPGSPISRVCSLASPGRHVRFAQKYVVHGDASFCAERKIPTNIAGIADKVTTGFREQMPRRPEERLHDRHINRIQSFNPSLFFKKKGGFQDCAYVTPGLADGGVFKSLDSTLTWVPRRMTQLTTTKTATQAVRKLPSPS